MTEHQKEMFHLAAAGAAPALVTTDEIDFDEEPAVQVPVEEVPRAAEPERGAKEPAVPSPSERQAEQLPGGVPAGQLPSGGEQERAEEGTSRRNDPQMTLLHVPEWWEEHWKGMPEFKQEDFMPYKQITVSFETKEDMEKFAIFIGQKILPTTKSIWWPEAEIDEVSKLRWLANPKAENNKKEELREILDGE